MGLEVIRIGGRALRHMLGVLLLAWRRVVRAAGIALIVSIVVVEIVGAIATHHFPPYLLTTVVALALGIVVAYCVGVMVLVDELLKGTLDMVRAALGEVEAEARAAAIIAEREVGDVWGWAQRLIAGRDAAGATGATRTPARPRLGVSRPPITAMPSRGTPAASGPLRATARTLGQFPMPRGSGAPAPSDPAPDEATRLRMPPRLGANSAPLGPVPPARDETHDDIAATDVFRKTAPPSPANAHPVRADRLPRIEWAAEGLAAGAAILESALAARARHAHQASPTDEASGPAPTAAETPLDELPPLPPRAPAPAPAPMPMPTASQEARQAQQPAQPDQIIAAPPTVPLAPVAPAAAPPTVPLEAPPLPAPSPSLRPSVSVRTVPVMTSETERTALEAADTESSQATGDETPAPPAPDEAVEALAGSVGVASATRERADRAEAQEPATEPASEPASTWEPPSRVVVLPAAGAEPPARKRTGGSAWPGGEDEEQDNPDEPHERGLWSRISQALVRSTTRPLRERSDGGSDGAALDHDAP